MRHPTPAAMHNLAPVLALALALALPATGASAQMMPEREDARGEAPQTSPEARAKLEATAIAAQKLDSLSTRIALAGGGSDMFAKFMPSAQATLHARRNTGEDADERPWTTRVFGVGKDRSDTGDEYSFDFASDGVDITWVEHPSESVKTAPLARARGAGFSMREHLNLDELLAAEPLARELAPGAAHALEETRTVNGVECDVVLVTYPEQEGRRTSRKVKHNKSRWYLGADDAMPRRIDRVHATGYTISLNVTLDDLKLNPPLSDEDMRVRVPDGYEEIDQRTTAPRIGSDRLKIERREDVGTARTAPEAEDDPTKDRRAAPAFELKTLKGDTVTLEDQRGRVTVLYFWGTWCVPCRQFSPLVSGLAETFEGEPVSVFAPAFMSDPAAAGDMVERGGYAYTLLVDADEARKNYNVRVAPTIDIIDAEGRLITRETNSREESPEEIMRRVERTIREELTRMRQDD